jgi:hypothetical protein
MSRARDVSSRGGITQIIPTSIVLSGGSGSVGANGAISLSGAGSGASINGCFTTNYNNYLISIVGTNTVDTSLRFRMRVNGSDDTSANLYLNNYLLNNSGSLSAGYFASNIADFTYWYTGAERVVTAEINSPALAKYTTWLTKTGSSSSAYYNHQCTHAVNTAYDGFTLFLGGGGAFTGTIRIYGYNNG